jgi:NADH:ubiquinone oxidoreductase subunit 2 (subunit N)
MNMRYNLPKLNLILIAVSFVIIIIGFALMVGEPSGATEYNPDIFSVRRITVGPMIALFGFVMMIVAILFKKKEK